MTKESFFDIEFETPPPELELSVEMKCREVMNSNDFDDIKKYCTHLIRYQMRQDVFLTGMLGRLAELEALITIKKIREEKKKNKTIGRQKKKYCHIP